MNLCALLGLRPGIAALTGGGGKTAMLYTLAAELAADRRVVCCTTTHIFPPSHMPVLHAPTAADLEQALAQNRCVCVGRPAAEKLAAPSLDMGTLAELAEYVLVEADGSRGLPCKAHLSHEPVIPPGTGQIVTLLGASCFARPVREAVHRSEVFTSWTGLGPEDLVTPEAAALLLQAEAPAAGPEIMVFVNQAEDVPAWEHARRLAALLPWPVYAGALQRGIWTCLS